MTQEIYILVLQPILRSMFLRCYATSLKRPWLSGAQSAFDDARYRLSILLAAPFVVLVAVTALIVKKVNPTLLPGRAAAYLIGFGLILGGVGAYVMLGRFFKGYLTDPEAALQFDQPISISEIVFQVTLWICVGAYCLLMIFV